MHNLIGDKNTLGEGKKNCLNIFTYQNMTDLVDKFHVYVIRLTVPKKKIVYLKKSSPVISAKIDKFAQLISDLP